MLAVDTNMLVRLPARDDAPQAQAADQFIAKGAWVSHLVLQDADTVAAALATFKRKPALGFSDCLVREITRKAGHVPLGTFDKALAKLDGVQQLPA